MGKTQKSCGDDPVSSGHFETELLSDTGPDRDFESVPRTYIEDSDRERVINLAGSASPREGAGQEGGDKLPHTGELHEGLPQEVFMNGGVNSFASRSCGRRSSFRHPLKTSWFPK